MIFEGDRVGQLLVNLKNQNVQSKKDEHLYAIPKRADDVLRCQVFTYYDNDRKRVMFNPANNICIRLNSIKVFPMSYNKLKRFQCSETEMIDLLERQYIYPFLLFINGRFIPWEKIRFICSQGFNYLYVHDLSIGFARLVRTIETMHLIMMPTNIIYSMNVNADDQYQTFAQFNAEGLFEEGTDVFHRIYFNDKSAVVKWKKVKKNEVVDATSTHIKVFPECFFFWDSKGFFDVDSGANCFANKAKMNLLHPDEELDWEYVSYCVGKNATPAVDNYTQVVYSEIEKDINTYLTDPDNAPEYMKLMSQNFDLTMSRDKSYEVNRRNAINYILEYRTDLFYVLYDWHLNYFNITVDYDWVQSHRDFSGHLSILRRWRNSKDYYIIMMVNGVLYKYYRHHLYNRNKLMIPVSTLKDGDVIELMFFRNVDDYKIHSVVNKDEYYPLSEDYYNSNTMIYCKEVDETKDHYQFPETGNHHFPVDFAIVSDKDNTKQKKIVFSNEDFYGKDIVFAPRDTFRYYCMYVDDKEADWCKVNLGHWFDYCYDYDRYFVFYNGRRLDHDQYRMTVPCRQTTPFYEFEIYMTVPLRQYDRLEIFYLPTDMVDLEYEFQISEEGIITYPGTLPYVFSSRHYTFWANGKKIPQCYLHDIDTNRIQIIKDFDTTMHLKLTRMGTGIEELETYVKNQFVHQVDFKFVTEEKFRSITNPNRTIIYVVQDTNEMYVYTDRWHQLRAGAFRTISKQDIDYIVFGTETDEETNEPVRMHPIDEPERIIYSVDREVLWDRILALHENHHKLLNTRPVSVNDFELDYYTNNVYTKSIMWELLREHYIANEFVDVTGNFLYDYWDQDMSAFEGEFDIYGNPILDAANANREDNIDQINRYYP